MLYFATWRDRDYKSLPKEDVMMRTVHHVQRMLEEKFGDPRRATVKDANEAHHQAEILIYREDHPANQLEIDQL